MKRVLLLLPFLASMTTGSAQKHVYDDLLMLYVDEEYEKCVARAERYAQAKDTRRDPLPFLYLSRCSFEMGRLEKYYTTPEHKWASRDALRYAVRFRKKDKDLEHFGDYGDYWEELNTSAMEQGQNFYDAGEFAKARRIFAWMAGYCPENPGAWKMLALCQLRTGQAREAAEAVARYREAMAALGEEELEALPPDQRSLLRGALVRFTEHLADEGLRDSARAVIAVGREHFMDNAEFRSLYEEVH